MKGTFLLSLSAIAYSSGVAVNTSNIEVDICHVCLFEEEQNTKWAKLPSERQVYYESIGYTPHLWDNDQEPMDIHEVAYGLSWDEMLPDMRLKLEYQGWNEDSWTGEVPYYERDWEDFNEEEKEALETLGWTEDDWESPLIQYTATEALLWQELTPDQREAALFLGHDAHSWSEESMKNSFDPFITHLHIPELRGINLEFLSELDALVHLMDGNTVGDDENCQNKIVTMKEYITELRKGSKFYLKYEDDDPFKDYIKNSIGPKVLKYLGDALRNSPLRENGYIPEEYDKVALSDYNWSFWLGGTNTSTSMHFDNDYINYLWVAQGRKRVVMIPNDERTFGEYNCTSAFESHSCWTGVDILYGDLPPHAVEVELGPGDGILLPYKCWHAVQNLEPTVAFGFRYD